MICKTDIANLKTDILEKVGQKIIVKGSLGRSKAFEKEATIEKAYPNIFVVRYEENNSNVTYSYTDVLTRTVEVQVFDGNSYSPLIPPPVETKKKKHLVNTPITTSLESSIGSAINSTIGATTQA